MQVKNLSFDQVQFKALSDRQFTGYASTFGNVDAGKDIVMPGAFTETLVDRERPIKMRDNHWGAVIGKWLALKEDERGLFVHGELTPGHSDAENRYASMKHGVTDSMSIGYRVLEQHKRADGVTELHKVHLVEISVVDEPMNVRAQMSEVKSLIDGMESLKEFEGFMREACGFSRTEASALVSRFKSVVLGEQGPETVDADELATAIKGIQLNLGDR